jgi:hypothetical protein
MTTHLLSLGAAVFLALVFFHMGSAYEALREGTRSRWLSMGGGLSVAYVFLHLLPELGVQRVEFFWSDFQYLLALLGLAFFYGLERACQLMHHKEKLIPEFVFHTASMAIYSGGIGYILHEYSRRGWVDLILLLIAIGPHFAVIAHSFQKQHHPQFNRPGRWALSLAIVAGWSLSIPVEPSGDSLTWLLAFLAGGITLNALKDELPRESKSHYGAFLSGIVIYSLLLLGSSRLV